MSSFLNSGDPRAGNAGTLGGMFDYRTPYGQNHSNKWMGQVGDIAGTLAGMYFGYPGGGKAGANIGQSFGDLFGGNWTGLGEDAQASPLGMLAGSGGGGSKGLGI